MNHRCSSGHEPSVTVVHLPSYCDARAAATICATACYHSCICNVCTSVLCALFSETLSFVNLRQCRRTRNDAVPAVALAWHSLRQIAQLVSLSQVALLKYPPRANGDTMLHITLNSHNMGNTWKIVGELPHDAVRVACFAFKGNIGLAPLTSSSEQLRALIIFLPA